jgi:N-dimethylarginine dimethylaminohydrolase
MSSKIRAKRPLSEAGADLASKPSAAGESAGLTPQSTATLAMCQPQYFQVDYSINPWMHPTDWRSQSIELLKKAQSGWNAMYQVFLSLGVSIQLVPPEEGLPDMVFTANAAVVLDKKVLLSRFRYQERQREEKHFAAFFE